MTKIIPEITVDSLGRVRQQMVILCPKCLTENKSTARRCVGVYGNSGKNERCDFYWVKCDRSKKPTVTIGDKNDS